MQRCLQLATKGRGKVAPNPMVGCVIVCNNEIIGEGYHAQYGMAHAEVNAIQSVVDKTLLPQSTVYVSLEPCSHYGKTPPCADLLISHKVKQVVVGCVDPHAKVAGMGIAKLRAAQIEVITGVLEKECEALNKRFFTFHHLIRPYVILKWAETKNEFMAGQQKQISGAIAQTLLHQWRTEEMAFMVGANTLLMDNPALNVRHVEGNPPIRIAVDSLLKSEGMDLKFYDNAQSTIVLNTIKNAKHGLIEFVKLESTSPQHLLNAMYERNIQSVVIEGGPSLLSSFIDENIWDELRVIHSKATVFETGLKSPKHTGKLVLQEDLDTDVLTIYQPL